MWTFAGDRAAESLKHSGDGSGHSKLIWQVCSPTVSLELQDILLQQSKVTLYRYHPVDLADSFKKSLESQNMATDQKKYSRFTGTFGMQINANIMTYTQGTRQ